MSSRFPTLDIYFFCLSIYKQTRHVLVFTWSLGLADAVHSPVNKKKKKEKAISICGFLQYVWAAYITDKD